MGLLAQCRNSHSIDEAAIETGLVISASRPLSVFKNGRKLETSAGPGDGITAKRDSAKILGGVSHSCQGVTREAEPPPLARLRPAKPVCGYSCLLGFWKCAAAQSAKALSHTSFDSEAPLKPRSSQNLAQPDRRRSRPFPRETRRGSSVGLPRKQTDPLTPRWRCRKTLRKL